MSMTASTTISPPDGFTPRVGVYLAQLEDVRGRTLEYVAGLDAQALAWTPAPAVESIGTLLLHIAAVERSWIGEDIERRPMGKEWELAFPIRVNIAQVRDKPLEHFVETLDVVRRETKEALGRLSDADLARSVVPLQSGGSSESFSIEWILYHLVEHEAHHKGQIAVLKRLYRTLAT